MYAIVDIAGQQFKVEKDKKVFVHRLDGKEGSKVELDHVLLIDNEKNVTIGAPVISGAMVTAKILEHVKGDKVIVFKKKRRKGYKKKNGHRQLMTHIQIEDILEKGAKPKAEEKKKEAQAEEKKETSTNKKVATKTKKENSVVTEKNKESASPKKTTAAAKKPVEKKSAEKKSKSSATNKKPAVKKTAKTVKPEAGKTADKKSLTTDTEKSSTRETAEKQENNKEE